MLGSLSNFWGHSQIFGATPGKDRAIEEHLYLGTYVNGTYKPMRTSKTRSPNMPPKSPNPPLGSCNPPGAGSLMDKLRSKRVSWVEAGVMCMCMYRGLLKDPTPPLMCQKRPIYRSLLR